MDHRFVNGVDPIGHHRKPIRAAIALGADRHQLSKRRLPDLALQQLMGQVVAQDQPHLQPHIPLSRGAAQALGISPTGGQWLLHKHRLARGNGLQGLVQVLVIGGGQHHRIEVGIGDQLRRIAVATGNAMALRQRLPLVGAGIGQCHQLNARQGAEHAGMEAAKTPEARQPHPQVGMAHGGATAAAAAGSTTNCRLGWPRNQLAGRSGLGAEASRRARIGALAAPVTTNTSCWAARIS